MERALVRCGLILLLLLPIACRSTDKKAAELPCTCGTAEADFQGCPHASCLAGRNNPDNPLCVCGTMSIPK